MEEITVKIGLRKVEKCDLEWLRTQRNRPEIMRYFRQTNPITPAYQEHWYEIFSKGDGLCYVVIGGESGHKVGYVSLNPIDRRHKHAEFSIFIIPEERGKGYGKRALVKLLRIGFEVEGLHKIYSDVLDYPGEGRFGFYQNMGFEFEGRNRQHYLKDGKWVDSIQFSMIVEGR